MAALAVTGVDMLFDEEFSGLVISAVAVSAAFGDTTVDNVLDGSIEEGGCATDALAVAKSVSLVFCILLTSTAAISADTLLAGLLGDGVTSVADGAESEEEGTPGVIDREDCAEAGLVCLLEAFLVVPGLEEGEELF